MRMDLYPTWWINNDTSLNSFLKYDIISLNFLFITDLQKKIHQTNQIKPNIFGKLSNNM